MKKQAVSFEVVSEQINEMLLAGEKITVRNVLARIGGKTTIIAEHLKRWHLQNNEEQEPGNGIVGDEIIQAIITEKSLAIAGAVTKYKAQIKALEDVTKELNGIIRDRGMQLETKIAELNSLMEKNVTQNALFTAKTQSCDSSIQELKQQLTSIQAKLEIEIDEKYEAIKQAAVWQSKHEQLLQIGGQSSSKK